MKKIMILMAGALALGSAAKAQITIAPEVGINFANQHSKDAYTIAGATFDADYDGGIKLGVKVGANVNIGIGDHFAVQPGLFYSLQGSKGSQSVPGITTGTIDNNFTFHYIQLPVNLQYNFNDPGEGRFFIGVGGYVGLCAGGYNKTKDASGSTVTTNLEFSAGIANTYGAFQRTDYGVSGNVGYALKSGIFFRGMYQQGLANLRSNGSSDHSFKNTNITASIGYILGSKK